MTKRAWLLANALFYLYGNNTISRNIIISNKKEGWKLGMINIENIGMDNLISIALQHVMAAESSYSKEIRDSTIRSDIYSGNVKSRLKDIRLKNIKPRAGKIYLSGEDAVQTAAYVYREDKRMCILDFGDRVDPRVDLGIGSTSQECALCLESNLYNILVNRTDFYNRIREIGDSDIALYIPDVVFMGNLATTEYRDYKLSNIFKSDVINCPAPYLGDAEYNSERNIESVLHRLKFILDIAIAKKIDKLILGAWGCGTCLQDSRIVSNMMRHCLVELGYARYFDSIVIAVPRYLGKKVNYLDFAYAFNDVAEYLE